jgi:hypothetical protein
MRGRFILSLAVLFAAPSCGARDDLLGDEPIEACQALECALSSVLLTGEVRVTPDEAPA